MMQSSVLNLETIIFVSKIIQILTKGIMNPYTNMKIKYSLHKTANKMIGRIEKAYAANIPYKQPTASSFILNAITVSPIAAVAHVTAAARTQTAGK